MTRAERRHRKFRSRRKAERILQQLLGDVYESRIARKQAEHLKNCSCRMCGNPRKWFKLATRQERLAANWLGLDS